MQIPLVDLAAQHREVADEVRRGFDEVLENTSFILGPAVAEFEEAFAAYSGVRHCRSGVQSADHHDSVAGPGSAAAEYGGDGR